jgi:hypothetical protein
MTIEPAGAGLAERFTTAWLSDLDQETAIPELLPARLARACVSVLPVAAAGLSLVNDDFRVPLGASDDTAALAERLQFSQGEGPCLEAALHQRLSTSRAAEIADRWPALAAELFAHTPYRAIVSLPLRPTIAGAADFYLEDDDALHEINIEDAAVITEQVAAALRLAQLQSGPWEPVNGMALPTWLTSSGTRDRMAVWVAMGIVMHGEDLNSADALALLRAYAFGHDLDLDATAAQLVHGGLTVEDLA